VDPSGERRGTDAQLAAARQLQATALLRGREDGVQYSRQQHASGQVADTFYILDARPKANVLANTAIGGGVEDKEAYPDCEIDFLDIPNIHVVRTAYEAMLKLHAAPADVQHYHAALDAAGWLALILDVLRATRRMAETLAQGHSILSHCSDGWDRTSQLTSLTLLALDPSYRTLRGFAILIEKEWLAFGHKFQQRHGVGEFTDDADQISPIFLQFLDCVHQMLRHHPTAFEFNQALLMCVLDEAYSCRFGTFLYNTVRQRLENKVRQRTVSLWSFVGANRAKFTNVFYRPHPQPLAVPATPTAIHVWEALFDRHRGDMLDNERNIAKVMRDVKDSADAVWMQLDVMKNMIRDLDAENNKLKQAAGGKK
jgi:myotubularin-related protein 1/2